VTLWRRPGLRALAIVCPATVLAYLALGGKSYYALPTVIFALAAGAVPLDRWATGTRLRWSAAAFTLLLVVALPIGLPVLPLHTADRLGVLAARSDYKDEVGWPELARQVERLSAGSDVVLARNYGEAGALELFGRGLPPVASAHSSFRYWRPAVTGKKALLVGFGSLSAPFCRSYRVVGRISMPVDNEERDRPIARCTLRGDFEAAWRTVVSESS
jgi:hypothetical protein